MFVLEIDFHDGSNDVECLLVRRPRFVVGASKTAHVIIDEMKGLGYELQFFRGLGSSFRCSPTPFGEIEVESPPFLDNTYSVDATLNLGPVSLRVSTLDSDLLMRDSDPPDKAGVRILRQACAFESPVTPAIAVLTPTPTVISFSPDQTVTVGRSNKCLVRVDSADVSAEHARIGYESGKFWVEDLGSTNGTFVARQQISGRQSVNPGGHITLGGQTILSGVTTKEQLGQLLESPTKELQSDAINSSQRSTYPALVAVSDLVRPGKFLLQPGSVALLGRDPESDVWVGAPHISRKHCSIAVSKTGSIAVTDLSRNGIAWEGGILVRNQPFVVAEDRRIFDLGGGVNFAICFNAEEEDSYRNTRGSFLIAAKEQKAKESGTRVDLKTLVEQTPPTTGLLSQQPPGAVTDQRGVTNELARRFRALSGRDRAFVVLFLISLSVIIVVTVNLIVHGFR